MEIRSGTLTFPRARDIGPRTDLASFVFASPVERAVAGMVGSTFGFSPRDDHHLGVVNLNVVASIDANVVTVEGTFGVRDWSGEFDDDYEGTIQFVVLAELQAGFTASNLSITGVEESQTIQFFRSRLDPSTARPDNSIALVAGKDTLLRVFVDTGNDATRPAIASVSGICEVRLPGSSSFIPLTLLNAGPIPPKRDDAISRLNADDTLNFLLPGAFATKNVDFRVRAFDSAHADQPGFTSASVEGTLAFTQLSPLRVHGVGVRFTGTGGPIAAPSEADLRNVLIFTQENYPVGQLFISAFDVIDYDGNFNDMGNGCGSGWNGLLDRLREMQGDTTDEVFFGLVPSGVPSGAFGCGGGDGRVAAALQSAPGATFAQEIAHAFGRQHACGQAPLDSSYPNYTGPGALPMGSIGEVGIDTAGNPMDPAVFLDFMSQASCSLNRWVSPYTYEALRANFPPAPLSPDGRPLTRRRDPENFGEHLFFRFRIYRGGKVVAFPSFHYPSDPTMFPGQITPFGIELRDRNGRVVESLRVYLRDVYRDLDSAYVDFYKPIRFGPDVAIAAVTCGVPGDCEQTDLITIEVPKDPPQVRIVAPEPTAELSGRVRLGWDGHDGGKALSYLVRYSHDGGETYRAITPAIIETQLIVDLDRLPGGEQCILQVLVTEGIRTGEAHTPPFRTRPKPPEVVIVGPPPGAVLRRGDAVTLVGEGFSPDTGSVPADVLVWHSEKGEKLGTGNSLRLRSLKPGRQSISLSAPHAREAATVEIEIAARPAHKHTSASHPKHTSRDHRSGKVFDTVKPKKG
jgi:hypothetical protein